MSINKKISKQIWKEIKKAKNILLTFHPNPDGDSVGNSLALFHALTNLGKKVTLISGDSPFPSNMTTLPGSKKVIKKNIFEINLSDFDLFLITDISSLDRISRIEPIVFPKTLKTVLIDHHIEQKQFTDISLVEPNYPATCQIIFEIFQLNKVKITPEIAACLFLGIYTDTGGFKYSNTTEKTFSMAASLAKLYPKFNELIFELENNDHPDRLKFLSLILSSIETDFSNQVAIASLSFETIKNNDLNQSSVSSSDIANILKSITGWQIGICLIEHQPNNVKASFRTRDANKFDVNKIATALGGGGHKAAAGLALKDISLPEAKTKIIKAIKKVYPKLR